MSTSWRALPRSRAVVLALAGLLGLALFAASRHLPHFGIGAHPSGHAHGSAADTSSTNHGSHAPGTHAHAHSQPQQPKRPALTPAEEQYIRALWPIHSDVQRQVMRVSLGQIFYKSQDLGRDELASRVNEALSVYRTAEVRMRGLEPPGSLQSDHTEYRAAIRLFEESAVELLKMFTDGQDNHMLAAYPKSQLGSDKIREVGGKFWPNEFPPH